MLDQKRINASSDLSNQAPGFQGGGNSKAARAEGSKVLQISPLAQGTDSIDRTHHQAGSDVMGLYLCVFEADEELEGVEVGSYADFNALREYVTRELEAGELGSRFPTFIVHSDCDGEWAASECGRLRDELAEIAMELRARPAVAFTSEWQRIVAKSVGLVPRNALESFIDVDGELLVERLRGLAEFAYRRQAPILFQ